MVIILFFAAKGEFGWFIQLICISLSWYIHHKHIFPHIFYILPVLISRPCVVVVGGVRAILVGRIWCRRHFLVIIWLSILLFNFLLSIILQVHPHITIICCSIPLVGTTSNTSNHTVGTDSRSPNSHSHKMLILIFIVFGASMMKCVGIGASMELLGNRCAWRLIVMDRSWATS